MIDNDKSCVTGRGFTDNGWIEHRARTATLRLRKYARGEIGDVEFERRLERLLEAEEDGVSEGHGSRRRERSW